MKTLSHLKIPIEQMMAVAIAIAGFSWVPLRAQPLPWTVPLSSESDSIYGDPIAPALTDSSNLLETHRETQRLDYKNPAAAMALSLAGTTVTVFLAAVLANSSGGSGAATLSVIMLGGVVAGPSIGQFYANSTGTAVLGMALRVTGSIIFISGFKESFSTPSCSDEAERCPDSDGQPQMVIGIATLVGGTIYSIFDAAVAANRFNKKLNVPQRFGLSPTLSPISAGAWKSGAVAWMRF